MNNKASANDTSPEAEAMQLNLIREIPPSERAQRSLRLTGQMLRQAKDAIRRVHPEFTEDEVRIKFIELHYGKKLAEAVVAYMESKTA